MPAPFERLVVFEVADHESDMLFLRPVAREAVAPSSGSCGRKNEKCPPFVFEKFEKI